MEVMIDYMGLVAILKDEKKSNQEIIDYLIKTISALHINQTLDDYLALLEAANYLDLGLLLNALFLVAAQKLHAAQESTSMKKQSCAQTDLGYGIQKAYYLSHYKHLDVDSPVAIALDDLATYGLISDDALIFKNNVEKFIIHLITTSQYQTLQSTLDVLSKYSNSLSIKAHQALVEYVRSLKQDGIKKLFDTLTLQGESTLKMALKLVSAKDFNINLDNPDNLGCVYFFKKILKWVNGDHFSRTTQLLSKTYLPYVLPLIEPITGAPVTKLSLYHHNLTSLPDSIGNLVNLKKIYLSSNELTRLPDSIGNLVNLTSLDLSLNQLTSLPNSIGSLVNLKKLSLNNNQLASLPDSIDNLVNLTTLDLSKNQLASLPNSIGNLVNLTTLNLTHNKLVSLPDSIGNLSKLEFLLLYSNQLTSIPDSIVNLVNLATLLLYSNSLTTDTETKLKKQFGHINCFTI